MRRSALLLLPVLAACSGSPGTASVAAPSTALPTSTGPTAVADRMPAPTSSKSAVGTSTPAARVTATAGPSPTRSRTPSPRLTRVASPTTAPTRVGRTYAVAEVTGDRFSPMTLTVRVGDSVLVTDKDALAPHTFTVDALHADSGDMNQGDTYRLRFTRAGTFSFVCAYHQNVGMTGTVKVQP